MSEPLRTEPLRAPESGCPTEPARDQPPDLAADGGGVVLTLIDRFLAEQASTTAVERFSDAHDAEQVAPDDAVSHGPADPAYRQRPGYWRDLMPATPPGPGQQYAFEVDLDACSGCKACVVACSNLNGLEPATSFRTVGRLVGTELPTVQHVTSACHHCVDPGCLSGCPVDAYEKDPITGIVHHLDDQCIGCQYCTLTCPYEVPKYDHDRGIVRKCDLCHDRLADGEAPACVNACPTEAIAVRVVDVDLVSDDPSDAWGFVSPDPGITSPTTRFASSNDLDLGVVADDAETVTPAHAHPPLSVMLVLTQLAVGTLVCLVVASGTGRAPDLTMLPAATSAFVIAVVAMGASVLHLGRPQYAWRAVIGLRHSWLSREIVAFGLFAALAATYAAALAGVPRIEVAVVPVGVGAAAMGIAAVGTSAMVYAATGCRWWSLPRSLGRFLLTALLGGAMTLLAVVAIAGAATGSVVASTVTPLAAIVTAASVAGLVADTLLLRRRHGPRDDELARTARLLAQRLRGQQILRGGGLLLGGIALPWLVVRILTVPPTSAVGAAVVAIIAWVVVLAAEVVQRWHFFTAVAPVRMPGPR